MGPLPDGGYPGLPSGDGYPGAGLSSSSGYPWAIPPPLGSMYAGKGPLPDRGYDCVPPLDGG